MIKTYRKQFIRLSYWLTNVSFTVTTNGKKHDDKYHNHPRKNKRKKCSTATLVLKSLTNTSLKFFSKNLC